MPVIQLPSHQPNAFGQALAGGLAGLGQGVGKGISNLVDMKLKNLQRDQKQKNLESSLSPLIGSKKASDYSKIGADNPQILSFLMNQELEGGFPATPDKPIDVQGQKQSSDLFKRKKTVKNLRSNLLLRIKKNKLSIKKAKKMLKTEGFDDRSSNIILSETLTDDVIKFFLDKTNNNPKKAKILARQYGFKV